jgi:hypothetical protein
MPVNERTVQVVSRVPLTLAERALRAARAVRPGVSTAGTVRLALARLAGMSDDYADQLPSVTYRNRAERP